MYVCYVIKCTSPYIFVRYMVNGIYMVPYTLHIYSKEMKWCWGCHIWLFCCENVLLKIAVCNWHREINFHDKRFFKKQVQHNMVHTTYIHFGTDKKNNMIWESFFGNWNILENPFFSTVYYLFPFKIALSVHMYLSHVTSHHREYYFSHSEC